MMSILGSCRACARRGHISTGILHLSISAFILFHCVFCFPLNQLIEEELWLKIQTQMLQTHAAKCPIDAGLQNQTLCACLYGHVL